MFKTALVAMTIVGCDCDAKLCEYVSETPAQWTSVAECETAIKGQVIRTPGIDYPLVTGICRTVPGPQEIDSGTPATELASMGKEDGHSLYGLVRKQGNYVRDRTADGYEAVKAGLAWTTDRVTPAALAAWVPGVD